MISLEKARKLKEAGLKWEPREFDLFTSGGDVLVVLHTETGAKGSLFIKTQYGLCMGDGWTWLPSLDQLLAEIKAREYWWEINHRLVDNKIDKYKAWVSKKHSDKKGYVYESDTPEDAAADALLWILGQEKATKCKGCVCDDCDGTTENAQCPDTGCLYCPDSKDCEEKS